MTIINGRKLRDEILTKLKTEVASLTFKPIFCDVLIGEDLASLQYVNMKKRMAESIGISFYNASFPSAITTSELIKEIKNLNKIQNMCGIIVQLPLPESLDKKKILDVIDPSLDVDCLGEERSKEFYNGKIDLGLPAPLACMEILDFLHLDLKDPPRLGEAGKKILVLGQGQLVGKPVTFLLKLRGLNVEVATSKTDNKEVLIKEADVIISGMGNGKYITGDMVKSGVVIIDAGTSEENGAIVGDVDLESVKDVTSFVSPVPGGVGPVAVAMLLKNVVSVAKKQNVK